MLRTSATLIVLIVLPFFCLAGNPVITPEPSWITKTVVDYNNKDLDSQAEDGYVDLDFERQVSLQEKSEYIKASIRILSAAGVQNNSEVSASYDPSFQSLQFHYINIIRGGRIINKLRLSNIKTVQQEKELHRFIYNGRLTSVVIVEDVQKGDVLEYAYTIKGFNPIYNNFYSDDLTTSFSVPIYQLLYKVVVPSGHVLNIRNKGIQTNPSISSVNGNQVYEWKLNKLQALRVEDRLPSWYDPYSRVMISEYQNWKQVSDWALALFPKKARLSPALQEKVNQIEEKYPTAEDRAGAALRFVQDEIRYMGIEMGSNVYKPHDPSQVFKQRFGDCKDKSYLLCTMLEAMGIESDPVLINTTSKRDVESWLPTPNAFDHCVARISIGSNYYWVDPTISLQRGSIREIAFPDYQVGLIVNSNTAGFTGIPLQDRGKVDIREVFEFRSLTEPTELIVTTKYTGSFADDTRNDFMNHSLYEMKKTYRDFYAGYFDNIESDSISYSDDEASGVFTTREYYTIKDFWTTEKGIANGSVQPYVISSLLKKPENTDRTMPISINYPLNYHEELEVHLPGDWNLDPTSDELKSSAFHFSYRHQLNKSNVAVVSCDYKTLKDHIDAEESADYLSKLSDAEDDLVFNFTSEPGKSTHAASGSGNPFELLYVLLGICALVTYLYRRNKRKTVY